MSDEFQPSEHDDAYDPRGNRNPESQEWNRQQVVSPVSESAGYKAPGGNTREAIRARIQGTVPYTKQTVLIREWESEFEVRSMSLGDRNAIMERLNTAAEGEPKATIASMYPAILMNTVYDESGQQVWGPDDEGWLNSLPCSLLDMLAKPALELSGFTEAKVNDEAKKSGSGETSA